MLQYTIVKSPELPHLNLENVQTFSEVEAEIRNSGTREVLHVGLPISNRSLVVYCIEDALAERFRARRDLKSGGRHMTFSMDSTGDMLMNAYAKRWTTPPEIVIARLTPGLGRMGVQYTIPSGVRDHTQEGIVGIYDYRRRKVPQRDGSNMQKLTRKTERSPKVVSKHDYAIEKTMKPTSGMGSYNVAPNAIRHGRFGTI